MKETLYLDTYFFVNFIMDSTSILITSVIVSEKIRWQRAALAALFGAALSIVYLCCSVPLWGVLATSLPLFPVMLWIAFGKKDGKRFFFICLFFFLTSVFLGGAVNAIYYYAGMWTARRRITLCVFLILTLCGFTVWSLWGKKMKRRLDSTVISVSILFGDKSVDVYGLVDSGSFLCEPISKFPVILMKGGSANAILPFEYLQCLKTGVGGEKFGVFAVPLRTASGTRVLFGFRPKNVRLHNKAYRKKYKETNAVIVAVDFSDGAFAGCPCLVPLSLV